MICSGHLRLTLKITRTKIEDTFLLINLTYKNMTVAHVDKK